MLDISWWESNSLSTYFFQHYSAFVPSGASDNIEFTGKSQVFPPPFLHLRSWLIQFFSDPGYFPKYWAIVLLMVIESVWCAEGPRFRPVWRILFWHCQVLLSIWIVWETKSIQWLFLPFKSVHFYLQRFFTCCSHVLHATHLCGRILCIV